MSVSLQDVADKAGVSKMTASRALRGTGNVSVDLAEKIRKIARDLGYVSDPVMSRLASQRWGNRGRTTDSMIAFIQHEITIQPGSRSRVGDGIEAAAEKLGYSVDKIDILERGSVKGLDRELRAKGIGAIIIGRWGVGGPPLELAWGQYTVVRANSQLIALPSFSTVRESVSGALEYAIGKIISKGYRRIGFVMLTHQAGFTEDLLRQGTIAYLRPLLARYGIALRSIGIKYTNVGVLSPDKEISFKKNAIRLKAWCERFRPEVVLGFNAYIYSLLYHGCGYRLPEDVGYCDLHLRREENLRHGGLVKPDYSEGYCAVGLLDLLLRAGKKGIPRNPVIQQPAHAWVDSALLPHKSRLDKETRQLLDTCFPRLEWERAAIASKG